MAAVAAARRLNFAECSVAMRCVPEFDFGVSGSMSSIDSVVMG